MLPSVKGRKRGEKRRLGGRGRRKKKGKKKKKGENQDLEDLAKDTIENATLGPIEKEGRGKVERQSNGCSGPQKKKGTDRQKKIQPEQGRGEGGDLRTDAERGPWELCVKEREGEKKGGGVFLMGRGKREKRPKGRSSQNRHNQLVKKKEKAW